MVLNQLELFREETPIEGRDRLALRCGALEKEVRAVREAYQAYVAQHSFTAFAKLKVRLIEAEKTTESLKASTRTKINELQWELKKREVLGRYGPYR